MHSRKVHRREQGHTQEVAIWASVLDLYSSCVTFNDARAPSLGRRLSRETIVEGYVQGFSTQTGGSGNEEVSENERERSLRSPSSMSKRSGWAQEHRLLFLASFWRAVKKLKKAPRSVGRTTCTQPRSGAIGYAQRVFSVDRDADIVIVRSLRCGAVKDVLEDTAIADGVVDFGLFSWRHDLDFRTEAAAITTCSATCSIMAESACIRH